LSDFANVWYASAQCVTVINIQNGQDDGRPQLLNDRSNLLLSQKYNALQSVTVTFQKQLGVFRDIFFSSFFPAKWPIFYQAVPAHWALPECPYGQSATVRYNLLINGLVSFFSVQQLNYWVGIGTTPPPLHCTGASTKDNEGLTQ